MNTGSDNSVWHHAAKSNAIIGGREEAFATMKTGTDRVETVMKALTIEIKHGRLNELDLKKNEVASMVDKVKNKAASNY